jgi:hypothetical protein
VDCVTIVRFFSVISLYTRIQYVLPALIRTSGPGELPFTSTISLGDRHDCVVLWKVICSTMFGVNVES